MIPTPHTYSEWVSILDIFKSKTNDLEVLTAMKNGTVERQSGVTRIKAENVIAALIANKCIRKSDMDEVRYAKDRLFSDISGLEKIEVDESVKDIGSLEGLRKWLNEKKELLRPKKRDKLRSKGLQPPRGILLVGVLGCGKSLSTKSISANWKLPLY